MKTRVLALHGFLGCGNDWDEVRTESRRDLDWVCPNLFAAGSGYWREACRVEGKAWLAGYSLGGRMALQLLAEEPERWYGALLLSVNPGNFQTDEERVLRREADIRWAQAFRDEDWEGLMVRWNAQGVLAGSGRKERLEGDFDREKLAEVLERYSVADQTTDARKLCVSLVWMAGEKDEKFCGLMESMRTDGFSGEFRRIEGAGHRLLEDAPKVVARAIDDLTA